MMVFGWPVNPCEVGQYVLGVKARGYDIGDFFFFFLVCLFRATPRLGVESEL